MIRVALACRGLERGYKYIGRRGNPAAVAVKSSYFWLAFEHPFEDGNGRTARALFRGRWGMQNPLVAVIDDPDPFVSGALDAAGRLRIVEGVGREGGVQSQHPVRGQGLVLDPPDVLHPPIVVEDHVLATVPRAPARADHVLRHDPRRRSPFELARSDRLLDQGIDDEPVTEIRVRHLFGDADPAAELAVDPVQGLLHRIGQHEEEGPSPGVAQRQRAELATPGQLHPQPPFVVGQAIRGGELAQPVPVQVPPVDRWTEPLVQNLGETAAVLGEQRVERLRGEGQLASWSCLGASSVEIGRSDGR